MLPNVGQVVRVRTRSWVVDGVSPAPSAAACTAVHLSCLDDDNQGAEATVLWERELDAEVLDATDWSVVARRGFDDPDRFAAFLRTQRWNAVTSTDTRLFQSPYRAGIELKTYQLEPLRKALALPRVNLFIADDVGLGKTIEAGLIVRELIQRQKVRKIVIACPAAVEVQWREEMEERFGLLFETYDRAYVARQRQARGFSFNPWKAHTRFILSHNRLADESYASMLRDWLGGFAPGSLLILDEAHHVAPASGGRYAIDSQLTRVVRDIAPLFEHRLFLSATPHNGHSNSFSALLEILDPQRFVRGVPVRSAKELEPVMVRRLKQDLREIGHAFPKRETPAEVIDGLPDDAPELVLPALLDRYRTVRMERLHGRPAREQQAAKLVMSSLQKRLLSSVEAFGRTLERHRRTMAATDDVLVKGPVESPDALEEPEQGTLDIDEVENDAVAQNSTILRAVDLQAEERDLLDRMARIAGEAGRRRDPRVDAFIAWLRRELCPQLGMPGADRHGATWAPRRVLVFTEYLDTLDAIERQLRPLVLATDRGELRIGRLTGDSRDASRREIVKRAFNADPATEPLRILLCTDAAREGLNLQSHCADLFHFDLPWNPARLEQRNGRIDRTLQRAKVVNCHYFLFRQRPEDVVLETLVRKCDQIRREHVALAPVLDERVTRSLRYGFARRDAAAVAREIDAADVDPMRGETTTRELETLRRRRLDLDRQIAELGKAAEASEEWLGFRRDRFQQALGAALEMQGAGQLQPIAVPELGESKAFHFPALDRLPGADPSWAATLDSLRRPRRQDERLDEWRRDAEPRPVVFEDRGIQDGRAVHLHLEHRVVRRLLGRFVAQGFLRDALSRACVVESEHHVARVVLIGRLSLYGPRAARLHDEVIAITAPWQSPDRKRPLAPFTAGGRAEDMTLERLEEALTAGKDAPESVRERLRSGVARDVADLLPHLDAQAQQASDRARRLLSQRGGVEAQSMIDLLNGQRVRIEAEQVARQAPQLMLEFSAEERRQREAEERHWGKRLGDLALDLDREPRRLREAFTVNVERMEPLGLVYLWPAGG